MSAVKPPRPLPDLPRIENPGTIGLLVARWFEWEDWGAAAKLVDALDDAGRTDDAREVRRIVGGHLNPEFGQSRWPGKLLRLLMWDVFDWNACCEQVPDILARRSARIAADLREAGHLLLMPNGEPVPEADWELGDTGTSSSDPVQAIIAFAALRDFTPVAESQEPVRAREDGPVVGLSQEITFRRVTLNTDENDEPPINDDHNDTAESDPPGDAVPGH